MSPFAGPRRRRVPAVYKRIGRQYDEETFSVGTLITYSDLSFNEWN